jgi:hypothetical protein
MDTLLALMLSVIGARAISLVALGLRVYAQTLCDRRRLDTLVTMALCLPPDGVVEVDHTTGCGDHIRLRIVAGPELERENDARARTA